MTNIDPMTIRSAATMQGYYVLSNVKDVAIEEARVIVALVHAGDLVRYWSRDKASDEALLAGLPSAAVGIRPAPGREVV